jgi:hypothetical protein
MLGQQEPSYYVAMQQAHNTAPSTAEQARTTSNATAAPFAYDSTALNAWPSKAQRKAAKMQVLYN